MPTVVLKLNDRVLERYEIGSTRTLIGRDAGCDIVIDNQAISRHHAMVEAGPLGFMLWDLGSVAGLEMDGEPVDEAPLSHGTEVSLGKFTLVFEETGGVPLALLAERATHQPPEDVDETMQVKPLNKSCFIFPWVTPGIDNKNNKFKCSPVFKVAFN